METRRDSKPAAEIKVSGRTSYNGSKVIHSKENCLYMARLDNRYKRLYLFEGHPIISQKAQIKEDEQNPETTHRNMAAKIIVT